MGFLLTNQTIPHITQVPNEFIDIYMPQANGSFVKVYLYLLRKTANSSDSLTIEEMADRLSNTEADIVRALHYWEREGILALSEADGQIKEITLLPLSTENAKTVAAPYTAAAIEPDFKPDSGENAARPAQTSATAEMVLPIRHTYSPLQAEALKKDTEIESCLSTVEALLGTTLGDQHMQLILYLMSDLGFSLELVVTLYETALSRGKSKPRYIETIALNWAKKGIYTAKEAEEEASDWGGTYKVVSRALGIKRALAPAEKKIIDKWSEYHFSDAILEEACSRTVLQSGDTNLNYTTRILEDWHRKGVSSLKDIEDCDKSYFRQKNITTSKTIVTRNKFQNFPQRDYSRDDFADLEKQLLKQ